MKFLQKDLLFSQKIMMSLSTVKTKRRKETYLDLKADYSKRKTEFLKEIVKNIMSKRSLFENRKYTDFYRNTPKVTHILRCNC